IVKLCAGAGRIGPVGELVIGAANHQRQTALDRRDGVQLPAAVDAVYHGAAIQIRLAFTERQFVDSTDDQSVGHVGGIDAPFGASVVLAVLIPVVAADFDCPEVRGNNGTVANQLGERVGSEDGESIAQALFDA